jgi:hypothetical protein
VQSGVGSEQWEVGFASQNRGWPSLATSDFPFHFALST